MNKHDLKKLVCQKIDELSPILLKISDYLYKNPELSTQEFKAVQYLKNLLLQFNFAFKPILQDKYATAFIANKGIGTKKIGFLTEYDALPDIGHGCGHNLIALMSISAGVAFNAVTNNLVQTIIYGCPAEETLGAKLDIADSGLFDDVSACLIIHPDDKTTIGGTSFATHPLEISFLGKEAHVADPVYHGVNALDALVDFYTQFKILQQSFTKKNLIGTIITEGGTAPNIISAKATLRSTIRSTDTNYLENVMLPQIKALAKKVATKHQTGLNMYHYEPLYKNLQSDKCLNQYYQENFKLLNEKYTLLPDDFADGSTDVGNVSHVTRTCQPTICIGKNLFVHTKEFCTATTSDFAQKQALLGAKAMAMTAIDVLFEDK